MAVKASPGIRPASIYDDALREAQRHKWIESQKQGRDLGEQAIRDWFRKHWRSYCRHRRVEHLRGRQRWAEFDDDAFGRVNALILRNPSAFNFLDACALSLPCHPRGSAPVGLMLAGALSQDRKKRDQADESDHMDDQNQRRRE